MPRRGRPEGGTGGERVRREQERQPEPDEEQLRSEIDQRDDQGPAVQTRAVDQPHHGDARDHAATDDDVPRPVDLREERAGDVVRQEER